MQIALIVVAGYALLVSVLWWLFPRTTIVIQREPTILIRSVTTKAHNVS